MDCRKWICSLWTVLAAVPALAEESGKAILDKARDCFASTASIRRVETTESSSVIIAGQSRLEQRPQTSVLTIEINLPDHLARETATVDGQKMIMLKRGERAAMKLGDGPWMIPTGMYAKIAKTMDDLFGCEKDTPETDANAPVWKVTGGELLSGQEVFVVASEGNSGVALAQQRMRKAAESFSALPGRRPEAELLEYSAKHWIRKSDYRRLQAVQVSKVRLVLAGDSRTIEQSSKTMSQYSYEDLTIDIPEDARKVLDAK